MTWLDIVILLPLLVGLVLGFMKGLISELIAIAAVVLGLVGARLWGLVLGQWIQQQFTWPETVCHVIAYAVLFVAIAIALNIVGRLLSKLIKAIHLGLVNRFLGGIFGAAKWALVVLVLVMLLQNLDNRFHFLDNELKQSSVVYQQFGTLANDLLSYDQLSLVGIELGKSRSND